MKNDGTDHSLKNNLIRVTKKTVPYFITCHISHFTYCENKLSMTEMTFKFDQSKTLFKKHLLFMWQLLGFVALSNIKESRLKMH